MKNKKSFIKHAGVSCGLLTVAVMAPAAHADVTATNAVAATATVAAPTAPALIPAWLTDLSAGVREGYDNNLLLVSGNGLAPEYSWITTISGKVGVDFAPLMSGQSFFKTLTLAYVPEANLYVNAPQETYVAHRVLDSVRASAGNFSTLLDNAFLYNDGNHVAPIYAESQAPGGNTDDRFRNFYAQAVPRERRNQIQDRGNIAFRYDWDSVFIRPTATLLYYNLNTVFHNAGTAPYIGYQNWPDRFDANGGVDGGYQLTPKFAVTLGYRYGHQYQQQFSPSISPDQHYSSNDYQRMLVGVEGSLWGWLTLKGCAGPDFRSYNSMAAVNNRHPTYVFAEASATATITPNQSLTFYTKEWQWVASTGLVPYYDSAYTLNYHWDATRHWGFDLGGKILNANFTDGDDKSGANAPSLRNDIQYTISAGVTYNFTANLSANATCNYNVGRNLIHDLAPQYAPDYRDFDQTLVSAGVQYKF